MDKRSYFYRFLRAEGFAIALSVVAAYWALDLPWLTFFIVILLPDISVVGYLFSARAGARYYNLAHSYACPALLLAASTMMMSPGTAAVALAWIAHIAVDRALGYGLKSLSNFNDTHLGMTGRQRPWRSRP